MVSGDRDLIQLVRDPSVRLLFTVRGVSELLELDEATVLEKYGVPASRYAEFAILRGDPSDELPGVQGVGEKTARALIQTYGSHRRAARRRGERRASAGAVEGEAGAPRAAPRGRRTIWRPCASWCRSRSTCPVEVWAGTRDDDALRAFAEEHGLRGSVVRLLAAMDSTGST